LKNKIITGLFLLLLCNAVTAQKFDLGFTVTPLSMNRLGFDKPALILNDYYSYDVGKNSFSFWYPTLLGLFNSGIYIRYDQPRWFLKTEINYQTKSFRYAQKSDQFENLFFYYSCVEVPVYAGIRLNPEHIYRFKIQAGINSEIGKFNHNSFISPFNYLGLHINANQAMLEKISPVIFYYHVGVGIDYYGISIDLRAEKNINNLNKTMYEYNANFTDAIMIRLSLGFKITGRHWDKFRKNVQQIKKE
jgi:hypothetical protein